MSTGTPTERREPGDTAMGRTYARVLVFWATMLLALWMFQRYFGS